MLNNITSLSVRLLSFRRLVFISLLAFSMTFLSACGGSAASAGTGTSYIAHISGAPDSARIGIVVEDGKFAVYVCSLDDAFNLTSARWYSGDIGSDGSVQGISPDGVKFQGIVSGDQFSGTLVNTAGQTLTFSGTQVQAGGPAGLYRGLGQYDGQDIVAGAVIDTDGSFASTIQYKDQIAFVTPIANAPSRLDNTSMNVTIGDINQQVKVVLVNTLK